MSRRHRDDEASLRTHASAAVDSHFRLMPSVEQVTKTSRNMFQSNCTHGSRFEVNGKLHWHNQVDLF